MIITIRDKAYSKLDLLSIIIGKHGKSPWDFEIILPATRDNMFITGCLYEDAYILGIDDIEDVSAKSEFTITKIESRKDANQNIFIVSGIGKVERLLENSVALWDLNYDGGENGVRFIERVLNTFTSKKFQLVNPGGLKFNFKPIKKGEFLSKWYWDNFKKESAICIFRHKLNSNTYTVTFSGNKGSRSVLMESYISRTSVWEKYFNAAYALGNSTIFRFGRDAGRLFFLNEVKSGSFGARNLEFRLPNPVNYAQNNSLNETLDKILWTESYNDLDHYFYRGNLGVFSYQHQYPGKPFGGPHKSVEVLIMPEDGDEYTGDTTGRVSLYSLSSVNIEDVVKRLRVVQINYNAEPPTITNLSYRIENNKAYYDGWPLGRGFNDNYQYGILCSHSYEEGFVTDPVTSPFNDQGILDVLAIANIDFSFPEDRPVVDYEVQENQYAQMELGDNIVSLNGDVAILTDKVISYENGEVHYDCTTKDLLEIEAKQ